jgi:hypothetical protein
MTLTRTYTINSLDTDAPAAWMEIARTVTPGAQDSGRCRFRAEVEESRRWAFESALEIDMDVIDWSYADDDDDY